MEGRRLAKPAELVAVFDSVLPDDPRVLRKPMFGMPAAFVGGNLFTGLFEDSMMVRLAPEKREQLLALPGAQPFAPMAGRPMKEYVVVPATMIGDREALQAWVEAAFEYGASLPDKSGGKTKPGSGGSRKR